MKKYMYTRLIFSFLFIAFFATSCYTQLAVVKPHRVYVYERTVEPDEQEEPADTVYYEDEEEPASEVYVDVDNYYGYPPPATWRSHYYDPYYWDSFYWDDFYYSSWNYPYNFYRYDYFWHRPALVVYFPWYNDYYYNYGYGYYGRSYKAPYKPRHFARGGSLLNPRGSRHVASGGRSAGKVAAGRGTARRTVKSRAPGIRRADDIRVVRGSAAGSSGGTSVTKTGTRRSGKRIVKSPNRRTGSRKVYKRIRSERKKNTGKIKTRSGRAGKVRKGSVTKSSSSKKTTKSSGSRRSSNNSKSSYSGSSSSRSSSSVSKSSGSGRSSSGRRSSSSRSHSSGRSTRR